MRVCECVWVYVCVLNAPSLTNPLCVTPRKLNTGSLIQIRNQQNCLSDYIQNLDIKLQFTKNIQEKRKIRKTRPAKRPQPRWRELIIVYVCERERTEKKERERLLMYCFVSGLVCICVCAYLFKVRLCVFAFVNEPSVHKHKRTHLYYHSLLVTMQTLTKG